MGALTGMRILVVGGGTGIGRSVANAATEEGARVLIAGRRQDLLDSTVSAAQAAGRDLLAERVDLSVESSVARLAKTAQDVLGGVDGLVNAAAVADMGPSAEAKIADIEQLLRINLVGAAHLTQVIGAMMIGGSGGTIVQIGSIAGEFGIPRRLAYVMSKHGLNGLARTLAAEWGPFGVRVNGISPHLIRTPIMNAAFESGRLSDRDLKGRIPLRRYGNPEDVAGPAVFLLSNAANFVTGHVLTVDGGWTADLGMPPANHS